MRQFNIFVGDKPISKFCFQWLKKELWARKYIETAKTKYLSELDDIPSFEQISQEIFDELSGIPYSYTLIYPLPERMSTIVLPSEDIVTLGDHIAIRRWSKEDAKNLKEVSLYETEVPAKTREIRAVRSIEGKDPEVVLEIKTRGYFDFANEFNCAHDLIGIIRSIVGLYITTGLIDISQDENKLGSSVIYKYRSEADHINFDGILIVTGGLYATLADCVPTKTKETALPERQKATELIITALNSKKSDRILLASRWLFDSFIGDNDLLSFVQTTICMEILLGDQKYADHLSVGDILSNRCAYMIGHNDADRDTILKEFRKIYSVRSEIVHRGKARLNSEDIEQFLKLREYVKRVIIKEITLLSESA